MRKFGSLLLTLLAVITAPVMAAEDKTQELFWVEAQATNRGSSVVAYYEKNFTSSLGLYALVERESDGYAVGYVGPTWRPVEWLQLGIGIGRENRPSSVRRNAFFSIDTDQFAVYGTFENGGSGPWHKVSAVYKWNESWNAGVMRETERGFGPRLEYNFAKNTQVWIAILRDHGHTTTIVAINGTF